VYEPARLAAVARSGLLEAAKQDSWDSLTVLAARLLHAPMAFLTVVDGDRSNWLATCGVDVTDVERPGGPVAGSFCQYVIADRGPFAVSDASVHPRTMRNLAVTDMGVRAWAGFPVVDSLGHALGSFCVMDVAAREWSEDDLTTLGVLAQAASSQIALFAAVRAEAQSQAELMGVVSRRLGTVVSSGSEMPWECDESGCLTYADIALQEYFGYAPAAMVGLSLFDLTHPDQHPHLRQLLTTGAGWKQETFRCVRRNGTELWMQGTAIALTGQNGQPLGFTGSCHPLSGSATEARRLSDISLRVREVLAGDALHPVYQPILSVSSGRLLGAEGLSRFHTPHGLGPDRWFADANDVGLAVELELHAVGVILAGATRLPKDVYVSVNVSPAALVSPALLAVLTASQISPDRLVVEITEHVGIADYDHLRGPIAELRALGVRLAVDDAGAGYSSFQHILSLAPEFIKLDRSIVSGMHKDAARRALATALVMFALEIGSTVIAEGIEVVPELQTAQALSIDAVQGDLFGKPANDWTVWYEWHARGPFYRLDDTSEPVLRLPGE
jgi:PAS domain S-box-containing protein